MKKHILLLFLITYSVMGMAQCSMTPNASTFILSPATVGTNYTLLGSASYPMMRAFYICQGTTVTIQNRSGADTFYVAAGGALVGGEPNAFRVFVKNGGSYNASNTGTATIYWETGATITNFTGPGLPPCPSLTISMTLIGPNACTSTGILENENFSGNVFVYPNPAQNEINVNVYSTASKLEITLYDILGNKMMEQAAVSNQEQMNISALANGIYFLSVTQDGTIIGTQKIVKQ